MRVDLLTVCLLAGIGICSVSDARATMGGATIIARVDTDGDHMLELPEVRAAAGRRYDLIKSKNGGHVTMLQLGGRLLPKDLKAVGGTPGVAATVSKEEYLGLVSKFFDEADARRKPGDAPGTGKLGVDDLSSDAGKKLVELLQ